MLAGEKRDLYHEFGGACGVANTELPGCNCRGTLFDDGVMPLAHRVFAFDFLFSRMQPTVQSWKQR